MPISPDEPDAVGPEGRRLCTRDELVEFVRVKDGPVAGEVLDRLINSASERLNAVRQFYASTGTRTFQVDGRMTRLSDLDISHECTVLADGVELTAADLRWLHRMNHPAHAVVLYRDVGTLTVTGHWGWPEIPDGIRTACLEWASRAYFQRQSRQADVVMNHETGVEDRYFVRMPSSVGAALVPYRLLGI
ncbi:MAG: hypothetical protein ITG02_01185 [Patulibacter sp.]|nr:hypothetical protein [Patulibacter sp.]